MGRRITAFRMASRLPAALSVADTHRSKVCRKVRNLPYVTALCSALCRRFDTQKSNAQGCTCPYCRRRLKFSDLKHDPAIQQQLDQLQVGRSQLLRPLP